jgi:hypothetical protein
MIFTRISCVEETNCDAIYCGNKYLKAKENAESAEGVNILYEIKVYINCNTIIIYKTK